jgi:hypothetical protein
MLLANRGHDADWIRALVNEQGAWANIPPKRNRKDPICLSTSAAVMRLRPQSRVEAGRALARWFTRGFAGGRSRVSIVALRGVRLVVRYNKAASAPFRG